MGCDKSMEEERVDEVRKGVKLPADARCRRRPGQVTSAETRIEEEHCASSISWTEMPSEHGLMRRISDRRPETAFPPCALTIQSWRKIQRWSHPAKSSIALRVERWDRTWKMKHMRLTWYGR